MLAFHSRAHAELRETALTPGLSRGWLLRETRQQAAVVTLLQREVAAREREIADAQPAPVPDAFAEFDS